MAVNWAAPTVDWTDCWWADHWVAWKAVQKAFQRVERKVDLWAVQSENRWVARWARRRAVLRVLLRAGQSAAN